MSFFFYSLDWDVWSSEYWIWANSLIWDSVQEGKIIFIKFYKTPIINPSLINATIFFTELLTHQIPNHYNSLTNYKR